MWRGTWAVWVPWVDQSGGGRTLGRVGVGGIAQLGQLLCLHLALDPCPHHSACYALAPTTMKLEGADDRRRGSNERGRKTGPVQIKPVYRTCTQINSKLTKAVVYVLEGLPAYSSVDP